MSKASGARESALFLDSNTERLSSGETPQRRKRARARRSGGLLPGIIDGERVLIATEPDPLEKGIKIQIRVALTTIGVMVMQHSVDNRNIHTGLGIGVADLICVVPPYGRFCGIEVKRWKTRNAKRDHLQRKWAAVVRKHGGVTGVATCVEEALAIVELAREMP